MPTEKRSRGGSSTGRSSKQTDREKKADRVRGLVLNDKQRALAGQAIEEITNTSGFQVILEILEGIQTRCNRMGLKEAAAAPAEEAGKIAARWDGYATCAQDIIDQLDDMVKVKERFLRNQRQYQDMAMNKIFRGAGGNPVL